MREFLFLLLVTLSTLNCLGIGYRATVPVHHPPSLYTLNERERGVVAPGYVTTRSSPYTKASIREWWGEPDRIETSTAGIERWIFKDKKIKWQGIIIGIFVPVPLMFPTHPVKCIFSFSNGVLIGVESSDLQFHFYGFIMGKESRF